MRPDGPQAKLGETSTSRCKDSAAATSKEVRTLVSSRQLNDTSLNIEVMSADHQKSNVTTVVEPTALHDPFKVLPRGTKCPLCHKISLLTFQCVEDECVDRIRISIIGDGCNTKTNMNEELRK